MSANLKEDILRAVEQAKVMNECRHKWIFQETKKKKTISSNNGYHTAHFHRVDIYYCENCCEIKNINKKESVSLPFGGIRHVDDFAPIWY